MRKGGICWVALTLLASGSVSTAYAGPNANAKILLHLLPPTTKNACTRAEAAPTCSEIVTAGALYPQAYFAYLLVTDADSAAGIAGVQCGVSYNGAPNAGVDIYSWTTCATLEFPSTGWPASGGGNLITWDASVRCQRFEPDGPGAGVMAVAGYFYCAAYGTDTLRVTVRPIDAAAKVSDCYAEEDVLESAVVTPNPSPLGFVVFSTNANDPGYNPCGSSGGGGLRTPGEGGNPLELTSSGFDPAPPRPPSLPFRCTIADGNALVIEGSLFTAGDELAFDYDPATWGLTINSTTVTKFRRSPPVELTDPADLWAQALADAYQVMGQHDSTTLATLIASLPQDILDSSFPVEVNNAWSVTLKFKDRSTPQGILLSSRGSPSEPPEVRAAKSAKTVSELLCAPGLPSLLVYGSNVQRGVSGINVPTLIGLFRNATLAASPNNHEVQLLREYGLEGAFESLRRGGAR